MRTINLLIIDDDKKAVERAMQHLKRHDVEGILGDLVVDDSIMSIDRVENYCPSTQPVRYDAVLIDYQLIGQEFTGILVSAWMVLQLGIPRIALTTATYNSSKNYFDEFIRKDEINDNPERVIQKIISCIDNFDHGQWLEARYKELMDEYNRLLMKGESETLISSEKELLEKLEILLDKYERILDVEQEDRIKTKLEYLDSNNEFLVRETEHETKMLDYQKQLDLMLLKLRKKANGK